MTEVLDLSDLIGNWHTPPAGRKFRSVDTNGQEYHDIVWGGGLGGGALQVVPHDGEGIQLPPGAKPGSEPPRSQVSEPDLVLPPAGPAGAAGRGPVRPPATAPVAYDDFSGRIGQPRSEEEDDDDAAYGATGTGTPFGGAPPGGVSQRPGHGTGVAGTSSPGAANGRAVNTVGKTDAGGQVYAQLAENYPPESIAWVRRAKWRGPVFIPWSQIDHDDMDSWAASHEPGRVDHFAQRIRAGDQPHPVVLVEDPDGNYIDVDGHHRALAYRKLGLPVRAWVGVIDPADRRAMEETHVDQVHEGADPLNKFTGKVGPHGYSHGWVFHGVPDQVNDEGALPSLHRSGAGLRTLGGMAARRYAQTGEPLPRPELGQLFSKWDLATHGERAAAEHSGAGWYQQLAHVIAGAAPHSPHGELVRGLDLPAVPRPGQRLRVPISDWSEDPAVAHGYGNVTLHLPAGTPAADAHALGDEAPMSRWLAGGGSYRVARVSGRDVWLEPAASKSAKDPVAFILARAPDADGKWRYLIQQRSDGSWGLPGGHAHPGEDPWDAAYREAGEEMGELPPMTPAAVLRRDQDGTPVHTFLVQLPAQFQPTADGDEASGHAWMKKRDVEDLPLHPGMEATWEQVKDEDVLDPDTDWGKCLAPLLAKVGPKGYVHGWVYVGPPGRVGTSVYHPRHGRGKIVAVPGKDSVEVQFGASRGTYRRKPAAPGTARRFELVPGETPQEAPPLHAPPLRGRPPGERARPGDPMYHGSSHQLQPGDLVDPAHGASSFAGMSRPGYSYFTPSQRIAARYAQGSIFSHSAHPHVYEVEPTGSYGDDPGSFLGYRSPHPLRVVREIPFEQAHSAPPVDSLTVRHGPLYAGQDAEYEADRQLLEDKWYGAGAEAAVGKKFNPLELRDAHGRWTRGGAALADLSGFTDYKGRPKPSAASLSAAKKMVQADPVAGYTAHQALVAELAGALDKIDPHVRDALAQRWKVRYTDRKGMALPDPEADPLGVTGSFSDTHAGDPARGQWEIRVARKVGMDPATLNSQLRSMQGRGYAIAPGEYMGEYAALRYTVTHELGHALAYEAQMRHNDRNFELEAINAMVRGLTGDPAADVRDMPYDKFAEALGHLSDYGMSSPAEGEAEAFVAWKTHGVGKDGTTLAQGAGHAFETLAEGWVSEPVAAAVKGGGPLLACSGLPSSVEDYERRFRDRPGGWNVPRLVKFPVLDLTKVGPRGYVHGWVCVRPPCGAVGDEVVHPSHGLGRITATTEETGPIAHFHDGVRAVLGREQNPGALGPHAFLGLTPGLATGDPKLHERALAALRLTPDGTELAHIVEPWIAHGRENVPRIRANLEKLVNGEKIEDPEEEKECRALLEALRSFDASDQKLYRGMMIPPAYAAEHYQPGKTFYAGVSSFSSDPKVVDFFTTFSAGDVTWENAETVPVVLRWFEGDKRALPVENLAPPQYADQHEYLAGGQFVIQGTTREGNTLYLDVKQVKPL